MIREPSWDQEGASDDDEDRAPSWPVDDEETARLPAETMATVVDGKLR